MAGFKPPRMKIMQMGLCLIAIPLVFGFAFILILENLMQTYRHVRNQSVNAINVCDQIYRVCDSVHALEYALFTQSATNALLEDRRATVSKELSTLRDVAETNHQSPRIGENLTAIRQDWAAFETALHQANPTVPAEFDHQGANVKAAPTEALHMALQKLQLDLDNAGRGELIWSLNGNKDAREVDSYMQVVLVCALVMNVLLCPFAAFYFSHNLSKRLQVLIDNSERFAQDRVLLFPLGGADEITQADQVFREMAKTVTEAKQAQKEFIAMINHDIRTPLTALQATFALISEGIYGELSPEGAERARAAELTALELVSLIGQLLNLEKIKNGNLELQFAPVRLRSLINRASETLYGFIDFKNIRLNVSGDDLEVAGDEVRLTQLLVNLLSNAIKFAPEGSQIEVSISRVQNDWVEVGIEDSGEGIPAGMEDAIFERFSQLETEDAGGFAGSGLGLSICKQIVQAHRGEIGVKSEKGKGSVFWFRLREINRQPSNPPFEDSDT
jgi:signal transduction histidine kinase